METSKPELRPAPAHEKVDRILAIIDGVLAEVVEMHPPQPELKTA